MMRFMPKILAGLFRPAPLPDLPPDVGPAADHSDPREPFDLRIARLTRQLADRMVAAEAGAVAAQQARVEPLFADFARQIEDAGHHDSHGR